MKGKMFVGLDVHKESIQVAVVNDAGEMIFNEKIPNNRDDISRTVAMIPAGAKYVMESSSVWYGLYRYLADTLKLDVALSNPYNTKVIAASLKKTDRTDAYHLANLLRGGYIAVCYVPPETIMGHRHLSRHRKSLSKMRTIAKNKIHGILLQNGIKTSKSRFTKAHVEELQNLNEYRIGTFLRLIESYDEEIAIIDREVHKRVHDSEDMQLLKSIPGIGPYTALTLVGEIGDINRFSDAHKLCAYAGMVSIREEFCRCGTSWPHNSEGEWHDPLAFGGGGSRTCAPRRGQRHLAVLCPSKGQEGRFKSTNGRSGQDAACHI